jgi:DNA repair photolyase
MIISASRRTDIPAFYADWFLKRIKERYALVRNPMNPHQVSRASLSPEAVDGFVFWTKNPAPMLDKLNALRDYPFYFQFTLNAYAEDVETHLPALATRMDTFRALADAVGKERIVWRYDPILLSSAYPIDHHLRSFEQLARQLSGYTDKCVVSFIDFYPKISAAVRALGIIPASDEQKRRIAKNLSEIAFSCGLAVDACAEAIDLSDLGIGHARCVDDRLLSRISGRAIKAGKDRNQRPACSCAASVDIGAYDTCPHGCRYCYANRSTAAVDSCRHAYDAAAPLLCSRLGEGDKVTERLAEAKARQLNFLE